MEQTYGPTAHGGSIEHAFAQSTDPLPRDLRWSVELIAPALRSEDTAACWQAFDLFARELGAFPSGTVSNQNRIYRAIAEPGAMRLVRRAVGAECTAGVKFVWISPNFLESGAQLRICPWQSDPYLDAYFLDIEHAELAVSQDRGGPAS